MQYCYIIVVFISRTDLIQFHLITYDHSIYNIDMKIVNAYTNIYMIYKYWDIY